MFARLTGAKRLKAGWLLALVYLLCVLAPGLGVACIHAVSEGPAQHASDCNNYKDITYLADETPAPAKGTHKNSGTHCCYGIASLSALPAPMTEIVKPSPSTFVCASENYRNAVDNTPPRLYRPPIA